MTLLRYLVCLVFFTDICRSTTLTLLHTNDVHSRYWPINRSVQPCQQEDIQSRNCWGGPSRRRTAVDTIRKTETNVYLLDAGDQSQGTTWYVLFKHRLIAEVMNLVGYDAMTLGNHEFDDGDLGALELAKKVKFPIISTNIDVSNSVLHGFITKQQIYEVERHKIAIVGCVLPETTYSSKPTNVAFYPEEKVLPSYVEQLRSEQGVTFVVLLSHSGIYKDREMCKTIPGVDVIIGGHTNSFLYNGQPPSIDIPVGAYPEVYNETGRPCLVVTDYAFGKYLGNLKVELDRDGRMQSWMGNPILLDDTIVNDPEMDALLETYEKQVDDELKVSIGTTYVPIDGLATTCRAVECNAGNMVADSAVQQFLPNDVSQLPDGAWTLCSLAIINAGTFRNFKKDVPGEVTKQDLYSMVPFGTEIVLISIRGVYLRQAFEHAVFDYTGDAGKFLQVSGFKVVYDLNQPNGQRVKSILALCQQCMTPTYAPLDDDQQYNVACSQFVANGGDGFHMLSFATVIKTIGLLETDNAISYFKKNSPVMMGVEGRIMFADSKYFSEVCDNSINNMKGYLLND